jgi:hypothetical protein
MNVSTGFIWHEISVVAGFWVNDNELFVSYMALNWDSVVGIATGYGLDDRGVGVRVPVGSRIFSSPRRPDGLWGPPSLLSSGYRGSTFIWP